MNTDRIDKNKRIFSKVTSISLLVTVLLIVVVVLVYRFSNQTFYFYNKRFDVVVSDSMSFKNEEHKDFLEGHDNQIQRFDFLISDKVTDDSQLNVYDIVIFRNPLVGLDTHRIVAIDYDYTSFMANYFVPDTFYDKRVFKSTNLATQIRSKSSIYIDSIEALIYTKDEPYNLDEYYFSLDNSAVHMLVETKYNEEGYYENYLTFKNNSSIPSKFALTKKNYSFLSYFSYLKIEGRDKNYIFDSSNITSSAEEIVNFYPVPKYEIRGDASKTEDGWFYKDSIYAKVVAVIPKFGYFSRFISSIYGAIMLIGLGLLPLLYSFLVKKKKKHEK